MIGIGQNKCTFCRQRCDLSVTGVQGGNLRILGIDPGLVTTGYGVIDVCAGVPSLVEGGTVRAPTKIPLEKRLATIFYGIQEVLLEFKPDAVALEEVHTQYERPMVAVMMGHARGTICLAAALNQTPVFSYAPTHVKSALTGNGRAGKEQIRRMVELTLSLKTCPGPLDVSDALAIALCHVSRAGRDYEEISATKELHR